MNAVFLHQKKVMVLHPIIICKVKYQLCFCFQLHSTHYTAVWIKNCAKSTSIITEIHGQFPPNWHFHCQQKKEHKGRHCMVSPLYILWCQKTPLWLKLHENIKPVALVVHQVTYWSNLIEFLFEQPGQQYWPTVLTTLFQTWDVGACVLIILQQ